jgi:hypothetical protein
VDCLAPPECAGAAIRAAAGLLEQRGVDLIVSNQLHGAWCTALVESGFRMGPSNYLLALSPALAEAGGVGEMRPQAGVDRLKPVPPLQAQAGSVGPDGSVRPQAGVGKLKLAPPLQAEAAGRLKPTSPFHFNRGDGDGPIHL